MKKLMTKLFLALLVLGLGLPMYMKGPDGKPMMTLDDWLPSGVSMDSVKGAVDDAGSLIPDGGGDVERKLYKWQDKKGVWHYSDRPQLGVNNAQAIDVPKANVVEPIRRPAQQPQQQVAEAPAQQQMPGIPSPTTIPLKEIPKLIEDAKQLKKIAEERQQGIDKF